MKTETTATDNPYLIGAKGRKEWNDRYLNQATEVKHWKIAFFASIGACAALAFSLAHIANESHIQPYIVETSAGTPIATIKAPEKVAVTDAKLAKFLITQFIVNSRTVLMDTAAEKTLLLKTYAFAANDGLKWLKSYYADNSPLDADAPVSVKIVNAMPISDNTYQVVWDETKTTTAGEQTSRWIGDLTYETGNVNPDHINDNPFGFYITHVSWSASS